MDAAAAFEFFVDTVADAVALRLTPDDRVYRTADMADRLHAPVATVRRWCETGEIPARRIGRDWAITARRFHEHFSGRTAA